MGVHLRGSAQKFNASTLEIPSRRLIRIVICLAVAIAALRSDGGVI